MILPLLATIIIGTTTPPYPIFTEDIITTTWESMGEEMEYILQCSRFEDFSKTYPLHPMTKETHTSCQFLADTKNCRRLWYKGPTYTSWLYIDLGCYYIDLPEQLQPLPITPPEIVQKREEYIPETPPSLDIRLDTQLPKVEEEKDKEIVEVNPTLQTDILGIQDEKFCNFNFVKKKDIKFLDTDCNFNIQINKTKYIKGEKTYTLEIEGTYLENIKANVNIYTCKQFNILDPSTWFRCEKELESTTIENIPLEYIAYFNISNKEKYPDSFLFKSNTFYLKKILGKDISNENIKVRVKGYGEIKEEEYIPFEKVIDIPISISQEDIFKSNKPFSFPIDRYIGVTQWHGCTQYQCPHKGIDFGAKLNNILAVGDGIVIESGYDKYGGECNQGGNYVKIKHTNGMYSTYFHLNTINVNLNQSVKKGYLIGISGNSGKWNCQNLGYHLHFETRKDSSSTSHLNPVDYLDVDWDLIPTLGISSNPGRLTGDNPHPNF